MKTHPSFLALLLACACVVVMPGVQAVDKVPPVRTPPPLELASASALVIDLNTGRELFANHPDVIVPIASISKLMTAMVTLDARQPLDEAIPVRIHDTRELRGVYSRVRVNSLISRREMLRLALMSSENRAAASLAHNYPGGHARFVAAMNAKARALSMHSTRFVEPTGLSERNVSTARDLAKLLRAARQYPLIRELSTTPSHSAYFQQPRYVQNFNNTNPLVRNPDWRIEVTKTGFIDEAGHCLALLAVIQNRPVAMVLLNTLGKHSHVGDANRVRQWLETGKSTPVPLMALRHKQRKQLEWRRTQAAATATAQDLRR
ncbi:penicillin-binding protein 7 precursor [Azotobacter vinelandii CA]|uniref:Penicillin-binding protein 7 n=2 Tax=Azotobacter vinelandii TaxID=354 RepID=C1DGY2_AZOVD|nr:D-alanyl-D-alanine endopeptidase [Azotobacter vinelandii]ACO76389.1 penicillin-binding protein 7 precursor [Azotobacter vinelandii DJ]AGK17420.1 penicillin-binding protein 7 precursor [Azotobacter vinelandii CA]AGK19094.1 penicillin-binding protein 7 precursor [Azotobacter vinelandii CA6]WKN22168.1 D-alanyl-D-alanine endopeptidase [Azotobacter vinelandii]SFX76378.1 D-alanyl-D-alanine endopeptidase (penicillin-binding protein 7) [Azotobacter vinelandii]